MVDVVELATLVLAHADASGLGWTGVVRTDRQGFRLDAEHGFVEIAALPNGKLAWRWSIAIPVGHRLDAARPIIDITSRRELLLGVLEVVEPEDQPSGKDALFTYTAAIDATVLITTEVAAALFHDVMSVFELVTSYELFVTQRRSSDSAMAADATDWPVALKLLARDDTSVGMLGILFQRFESSSVHEHVFYHPNADAALRHRVVTSWDSIAAPDRPQPYGDPDAPSSSFAHQRAESRMCLMSSAAQ